MNNRVYTITDIEKFVESTRVLVFDSFGKPNNIEIDNLLTDINKLSSEEQKELETILTQKEAKLIAEEFIKRKTIKNKNKEIFIISEKKYVQMIESLNERMISNMINNLIKIGILDSAYDSELNDFIFWVKDDENKNTNS